MKRFIIFLMCFIAYSQGVNAQVLLNTNEIETKTDAGEGDLFKNSDTDEYYIGTSEGTLTRIGPQDLSFDSETEELEIAGGNKIDISTNAYISICEFIRGEAVVEQVGRILFTVHEDLNGYKTSSLTVSVQELSASTSSDNLIVSVEIVRSGTVISVNEKVNYNCGTTYFSTSSGNSQVTIQTGDIIRLNIEQTPTNFSDAPLGLTATLKLSK